MEVTWNACVFLLVQAPGTLKCNSRQEKPSIWQILFLNAITCSNKGLETPSPAFCLKPALFATSNLKILGNVTCQEASCKVTSQYILTGRYDPWNPPKHMEKKSTTFLPSGLWINYPPSITGQLNSKMRIYCLPRQSNIKRIHENNQHAGKAKPCQIAYNYTKQNTNFQPGTVFVAASKPAPADKEQQDKWSKTCSSSPKHPRSSSKAFQGGRRRVAEDERSTGKWKW